MGQLTHTWITTGNYRVHTILGKPERHVHQVLPIILVHGLGVSSRYMKRLASHLAPYHPVYAPDLPGFGKSSKPLHTLTVNELTDALALWMDATGIDKALMVGNSFGCQLIANLCLRHPGKAVACVLQGPSVDRHACSKTRQVLRFLYDGFFEDPSLIPLIIKDFMNCGPVRLWNTFNYMMQDKIEEKLPHINLPSLVISGTSDPVTPPYWASELAQLLPQGQLLIFKKLPHAAHYSDAAKLCAVIQQFIKLNIHVHEVTYK
jgi:2-hydroxy-6-oxonona-2,4-dienedioate hydrolase